MKPGEMKHILAEKHTIMEVTGGF